MVVDFAPATLDQDCLDGTELFQIPSLATQCQFVSLLRASDGGLDGPRGVCSGMKEVSDVVVVEEAGKEDWDFFRVMTAA